MTATTKIAAAVVGGYVLGRTRKLKLAVTVGSMLAGKRIATNPRALLQQGSEVVDNNPDLSKLRDQLKGELLEAGKTAAITVAGARMDALSDAIHDRAERLGQTSELDEGDAESEGGDDSDVDEKGSRSTRQADSSTSKRSQAPKSSSGTAKKTSGTTKKSSGTAKKTSGTAKKTSGTAKKSSGTAKKRTSSSGSAGRKAGG